MRDVPTARCQISDERKDEEIKKEKKERKTSKGEKTTPSLASLNSNYKEGSSSGSECNERVSKNIVKSRMGRLFLKELQNDQR